jgi:hypothetical protein
MRADSLTRLLPAAAALLLAACAGSNSKPAPTPVQSAPKPVVSLDPSYDWQVLVAAPFGTLLKDVPLPVHEVLLFKDEAHSDSAPDDAECYAIDGTPPRFIDRKPSAYLLCFTHDRLSRIQATVDLPDSQAAQVFADACGLWLKHAAQGAGPPPAPGSAACDGSGAAVAFSSRLETQPDHADALLSIKLIAADR